MSLKSKNNTNDIAIRLIRLQWNYPKYVNVPFKYEKYKKIVRPKYCTKNLFFFIKSLVLNWSSSLCVQLVSSLWFLVNLFLSHTSLLMFNQSNHIQRKGEHSFTLGVAEEDIPPPDFIIARHAMICAVLLFSS